MTMRLARTTAAGTGIAWCAFGRLAGAQLPGVAVDPHIVVLTQARPAGEVTVFNPRQQVTEFTIDLRFGYATTDSTGAARVELKQGPDSASAAEWVTPYPRHFKLAPGAAQLVRLLARAPANLADGEYWARLTVHSHDAEAASISALTSSDSVRVALTLDMATVMPVFFRKGTVATGIEMGEIAATLDGETVEVRTSLRRSGNAAFLGAAHVAVLDSAGREITAVDRPIAVYLAAAPRWRIPLTPAMRASARGVNVVLSTRRRDVPMGLVVQARQVQQRAPLSTQ